MRLWVDFNELNEDRVEADLDLADFYRPDELRVGATTSLFDGGGYECVGVVRAVDAARRVVDVELDWTTWRDAEDNAIVQLVFSTPWQLPWLTLAPVSAIGRG